MTCAWSLVFGPSLVFLSILYSSKFSDIRWTELVKCESCFSPLILLAVVSFDETDVFFILHFRFFRQLNKSAKQSGDFKPFVNNVLSGMSLVWLIWLQSGPLSLFFFGSSPGFRFIGQTTFLCSCLKKLCYLVKI